MTSNPRVLELLEEILDSGSNPEEVCRVCPELLPQVLEFWHRHRFIQAQVGALFLEKGSGSEEGEASKVKGATPRLVLAMAQYRKGQKDQALKTLAGAAASFDRNAKRADSHDFWIAYGLRREAEALILPK